MQNFITENILELNKNLIFLQMTLKLALDRKKIYVFI